MEQQLQQWADDGGPVVEEPVSDILAAIAEALQATEEAEPEDVDEADGDLGFCLLVEVVDLDLVSCPACSSVDARLLGALGPVVWLRCGACGMDYRG